MLSNSNSELVEVGDIKTGKTPVVVIPDLTQELIDSRALIFFITILTVMIKRMPLMKD